MTGGIVVVGGGLAGGTVASELRAIGHDGPLTLLCGEPHPPYERPPLSKTFLRGESPAEDTHLRPAEWYADHDVDLRTGTSVRSIDRAAHRLLTDDGEVPYERLVLATGCRARRLPLATTDEVAVHHLRTLDDAARLGADLAKRPRVLVVGGGWIGLEVAASARAVGASVTLVEPTEQPLSRTLGVEVGAWFADLHRSHGVDLRTGTGLFALDGGKAVLDDGSRLAVDVVVVGIGAVPDVDLARAAGLAVDNGILVDARLRSEDPDVLAIGDVAAHQHPRLGRRIRVEHWRNALAQGRHAARVLAGEDVDYDELPSFFSDQYDAGLEFFGHLDGTPTEVQLETTGDGFVARWRTHAGLVGAAHVNQWDRSQELAAAVADAL